jgi:molybdopterin molybdotransferase
MFSKDKNISSSKLLPLDEVVQRLLDQADRLESEAIDSLSAIHRVLAQDVKSALAVPGFNNSAMDGYAVSTDDIPKENIELPVSQYIAAGDDPKPLPPKTAARIFTGAPIPKGADAVVIQEQTQVIESTEKRIRIHTVPVVGQNIRRVGEDIAIDSVVLPQGSQLNAASLGLIASIGITNLKVTRRPRVAIFSTGNELVTPGTVQPEDLPKGSIFNSNRYFLRGLLQDLQCEIKDMGVIPDQADATRRCLAEVAPDCDLILTSGGVSVGEEDHVKAAVESLGELHFWRLAMKPGKPFTYGCIPTQDKIKPTHFMGLPGNPISSFVTFLLLVRPFLLRLQGVHHTEPLSIQVPADFKCLPDKRRCFLRVQLQGTGGNQRLVPFANQSSGVLTSAVWADGLADIPAGQEVSAGDMVRFIPF